MIGLIIIAVLVVVAIVAGVLIGRNNKNTVEAVVNKAEDVAAKAEAAVNKVENK